MTKHDIDPHQTILFVGAGLSMHLGLPSWPALMKDIGKELDFDPDIFLGFGNFLALAEYYEITKGSIEPLAKTLDAKWHGPGYDVGKSNAHKLVVELGFERIYTTNFDRWIEKAFERCRVPYHKIVDVNDIADSRPGVTDIIKFHGDFDRGDTLVITESNYFDRLQFEAPLDILLRADALHRPILFIGYSLGDINMRYLFHKLWKIWSGAKIQDARKKFYIFMSRPNPIEEKIYEKWGITPIVDGVGGSAGLIQFLESLKAPAKASGAI
jgi:hypothetical protein